MQAIQNQLDVIEELLILLVRNNKVQPRGTEDDVITAETPSDWPIHLEYELLEKKDQSGGRYHVRRIGTQPRNKITTHITGVMGPNTYKQKRDARRAEWEKANGNGQVQKKGIFKRTQRK